MAKVDRRSFIRKLILGTEKAMPSSSANVLVCVFLRGGADTISMFVPYADDNYYSQRPTIAIKAPPRAGAGNPRDAAIRLDDFYALHPKMAPLLPVFQEGRLAAVQAVGSDNASGSHFEAQDQMEHGEAYGKIIGGGWLGRHLSSLTDSHRTPLCAVAMGASVPESLRGAPTISVLNSLDEIQIDAQAHSSAAIIECLSEMYGSETGVLSQPGVDTIRLLRRVEKLRAIKYVSEADAVYGADSFNIGLREIARIIKANVGLKVACIDFGGWDTHFFQGSDMGILSSNIELLAGGLAAFDTDLKHYRERVTTIVMTEFGRRTYENSSMGTDHGRGFAMMAMGAKVKGGKIYGQWPGLADQEEDILGPSGLKIKIDYRSVLAETLAGALGNRNTRAVFPSFHAQYIGMIKGVEQLQVL